jgi:hypothetical protein
MEVLFTINITLFDISINFKKLISDIWVSLHLLHAQEYVDVRIFAFMYKFIYVFCYSDNVPSRDTTCRNFNII